MLEVAKAHTYGKRIDSAAKRGESRTHLQRFGRAARCIREDAGAQRGRQSQLDVSGGIPWVSSIPVLARRKSRFKPAGSHLRFVFAMASGLFTDAGTYRTRPERGRIAAVVGLDVRWVSQGWRTGSLFDTPD